MSGATDRRLEKIAGQLSPQQAILLWMDEAHQHATLRDYFDTLQDAPDARYPMMHLPHQVEQAVHASLKDEKPEVVKRAERRAVREVAFLFYLHLQVNTRLWGDWRAMCLQLAFCASEFRGLCLQDDPSDNDYADARQRASDAILEFLQWDVAVHKIADRYYAGTSPLFPEYARQLAESIETAEQIVTMFNDQVEWLTFLRSEGEKRKAKAPVEPIDLAGLKQAVLPLGVDLARHIVVMAKAEAADFMGEHKEALDLIRARLWPEER